VSPPSFEQLFRRFFGVLESSGIDYFAFGGVAVAVWGTPRETIDVDTVVCVAEDDIRGLLDELAQHGFAYAAGDETTFPIDGWLRLDLQGRHADMTLGRTPFDESALHRRTRVTLFGTEVWMVSPEDLVLYKLVAHRYKDLGDVEAVLTRRAPELDLAYPRHWAREIAEGTGRCEVPGRLEELLGRHTG